MTKISLFLQMLLFVYQGAYESFKLTEARKSAALAKAKASVEAENAELRFQLRRAEQAKLAAEEAARAAQNAAAAAEEQLQTEKVSFWDALSIRQRLKLSVQSL